LTYYNAMNEQTFFTPDFLQFYRELAANNDRDWFHANKKRYEQSVKQPFEIFVAELIVRMKQTDPKLELAAKDAIFRINRDVRFSKDKTPYKLCSSAIITKGGKKDTVSPGMYLELGPEKLAVYGGIYMPDKEQLAAVRNHIASNLSQFSKLLDDSEFKATYGTLRGEQNKILPKELQEAAKKQPLMFNKAFYFYSHLPAELTLDPALPERIMACQRAGQSMAEFLFEPLGNS
jgi:uncharacterized protein (TIGR02453 family)